MKKADPGVGDIVVCTVKEVRDFGVVCALDEFNNREGFIHISEITSGWIKYIRDYVREGQRIVCKVLDANASRGRFDLSLRRVNDHQRREKLREWKNEQRSKKIIENILIQSKVKLDSAKAMDELEDKFGSLSYALELAVSDPEQFADGTKGKEWASLILDYAKENLKPPAAEVKGTITLRDGSSKGIEAIKDALKLGMNDNVQITYVGAPHYRIVARAPDVKQAEELMRKTAETIISAIKKNGGFGEGPVRE
ncbi:MAG: translation initiation factor IF-2 subunit alpha [Thermoplasmatales archaeon]